MVVTDGFQCIVTWEGNGNDSNGKRTLLFQQDKQLLPPRQNGHHFTDDIFKWIFLKENVRISIKISLKFVPKGQFNNIPALVQIKAWPGDTTSHCLNPWWLVYWCIYASLGLNELSRMLLSTVNPSHSRATQLRKILHHVPRALTYSLNPWVHLNSECMVI